MRAFTRITAAAVLAAGLTAAGAGTALANTSDENDSRELGVLGLLLGGFFEEDTAPPASNDAPAAPAGQSPTSGGTMGTM